MKRSNLKRRAPLKRTGRLPAMSAKRRALESKVNPERQARKEEVGCCMICRKMLPPECLDADEIARGYAREACLEHPELQLISCRPCHERSQTWPPAKRLAYLMLYEIEQRCRLYCQLRGVAETHLEAEDVVTFLMFRKRGKK